MNLQEIMQADIARYERAHSQLLPQPEKNQSDKTDKDFRRNNLIGEIFTKYFPEVECFRPQLNKNADAREFKLFQEFLKKISKYKPVQNAWTQMIESKQTMGTENKEKCEACSEM